MILNFIFVTVARVLNSEYDKLMAFFVYTISSTILFFFSSGFLIYGMKLYLNLKKMDNDVKFKKLKVWIFPNLVNISKFTRFMLAVFITIGIIMIFYILSGLVNSFVPYDTFSVIFYLYNDMVANFLYWIVHVLLTILLFSKQDAYDTLKSLKCGEKDDLEYRKMDTK